MEEKNTNELGEHSLTIKLDKLKKFCDHCSQEYNFIDDSEVEVSFECIIGSLFPIVMDNIRAFGTEKYIKGYNQGLEDAKNEDQGNNGRVLH